MRKKKLFITGFGLTGAMLAGLLIPGTAQAAPGDASARGVVLALNAAAAGTAVVTANGVVGAADAPAGGGTDTDTALDVAAGLPPTVGTTATGTVQEVVATRGATASSASATVSGVSLGVLGASALTTGDVTATVDCPRTGGLTADTTVAGLRLFGAAATVTANSPAVTSSAAVTVPGITGARLTVAVRRVETITASTATAVAVQATLTLTGTVAGAAATIPVGTVTIASATCSRPAPLAAPTATGITPASGPQAGGQTVTITGTGFVPGQTTVSFDGRPATAVTVAPDGTSLTAVTPAGTPGPADVVVATPSGSAAPLAYTYIADGSAARVLSLTPTRGPTSGGTTVIIRGTGLTGVTGVTFDGVPATDVTVNAAGTQITATAPPNAAGPAAVVLSFPAGDPVPAGTFTYVAPAITRVSPPQGAAAGGTRVTITGTGLGQATAVTFDGVPGTDLVVNAAGTEITVTTPAGTVGPADVAVVLPGPDAVAPGAFSYVAPGSPAISGVDPDSGPTTGGTLVTITGTDLAGTTDVTFDGEAATIVGTPTDTSVTVRTPPNAAGPADVTVTTGAGTSTLPDGFTYVPAGGTADGARVTGIDPTEIPTSGGTVVTITGTGLTGATGVDFGGTPGTNVQVSPDGTSITVTAPARETPGLTPVRVVFPDGTVAAPSVTYVAPDVDFVANGVGPTTGGTRVEIRGTNLEAATAVTFDGRPGRIVQRPQAQATEAAGPVRFAGVGSTSSAPVGLMGPLAAPAGQRVQALAPEPILLADVVLVVVTPPNAAGPADIRVVLPGRDAVARNGFRYIPPVTISALTPDSGPTGGGQTVVITGSGFSSGTPTVTFDGVPAARVQVVDDDTLVVVTPRGAAGPANVVVTVAGVASAPMRYTYVAGATVPARPGVDGIDPDRGPTAGGTRVTVTGNGFVPGQTSVIVCGTTLLPSAVRVAGDGESLSFTTPRCDAGPQDVTIVTPGGVVRAATFTYADDGSGGGSGFGSEVGSGSGSGGGGLADTGADVVGITALGLVMLVLGAVLARRGRRRQDATA